MSLPFARLAKAGETPSEWPVPSLINVLAYECSKKRHAEKKAFLSQTPNAVYRRKYRAEKKNGIKREKSMTPTAIRLREWRAKGSPVPPPSMTQDAIRMRRNREKMR